MKLLHIIAGMDPQTGGVTTAVNTMIDGLKDLNVQSEVVCLDEPGAAYLKGVPGIHAIGPAKTAWRYSAALLPWLKANLAGFDAVIVHGLWQYHVYAVSKAMAGLNGKKPKLFVMPHGMLDPYFQKAEGRKLKAIRNWIFWKLTEQRTVNNADCLLFTCETEKLLSFESFKPYHPNRTAVCGLGIGDPPALTPDMLTAFREKCGGIDTRGCFLFISRINPKKGVDLLISAYRELKKHQGSLPKLVIAGPGLETEFGAQMKSIAANDPDIIFTGMLNGAAKWGAFYSCAAMILPSHQENFGFVVVEALACGTPVLISNQVNIWREVEAANGGIIGQNTLEGTKGMLEKWQGLPDQARAQMKISARQAYEQYFSLRAATGKLHNIIHELCDQ